VFHSTLDKSNSIQTDVLIIGAGIAGLEAARLLRQHGIKTIVVEARNRTGGRIHSVEMKNKHIFDMGAAWIHGIEGSIPGGQMSNPLWDLVQEARIETRSTEVDDVRMFYGTNNGSFDVSTWYSKFVVYVRQETREPTDRLDLQSHADTFATNNSFTDAQKEIFFSYLHMTVENQENTELDKIKAKDVFQITSNNYGVEPIFHSTGFIDVIKYLAKDVEDIRLEHEVKSINYQEKSVVVRTTDEKTFRAQFVLVTVPLGVLKSRTIEFYPPLPKWKSDAIDRLGFGLLDKAILLWDKAWWNVTEYFFLRVTSKRNEYSFWVNANKWNDRPALVCYFVGEEAERLEMLSDQTQVIQGVLQTLKEMFPDTNVPSPIDSYFTKWKLDRFAYGSYSYISARQRYQDPLYLGEPLEDRLLFAGEATSIDTYGFAHGALLSARREVTRLLHVYELSSDPIVSSSTRTQYMLITLLLVIMIHRRNSIG
jgi:monoamine oxidase